MLSADLELALRLADTADAISLSFFRARELTVEEKADHTPVTEADRAVERALRQLLAEAHPPDGILGEEYGAAGDHLRRWILDPIDGTRNFTRGIPVWGTLIALEERGQTRLGVVSAPALARRWWAERGAGAFADGVPIGVSAVRDVQQAVLSFALDRSLPAIAFDAWHARGYGDFWAHMLLAEGAIDGVIENVGVKEWDLAAVKVIVEEAGGRSSGALRALTAERASPPTDTCTTRSCRPFSHAVEATRPDGEPAGTDWMLLAEGANECVHQMLAPDPTVGLSLGYANWSLSVGKRAGCDHRLTTCSTAKSRRVRKRRFGHSLQNPCRARETKPKSPSVV